MLVVIIIAVYFLGMVIIGIWSRGKARGADDFFVAGRKGSSLYITGSLLATIIGGSATVGMAGLGFTRGLTGAWWLLVGTVGLVALGLFFAGRLRRFGFYTLPQLVAQQYDSRTALAASILIVISWLGIIAGQIVAAGKIMSVLTIGDPVLWVVIFTAVFVAYTIMGGQHSVIRTDALQILIIFVGVFGGLALLLYSMGGFGELRNSLPAEQFAFPLSSQFGVKELVSYLLLIGLVYFVGPDMYSRVFCARDEKTARASVFWAALLIIPFAFGITLMGMCASALFPQISPEQAFPTVINEVFHPVIGGIVLAALLSAVMSSADTTLLSASTILVMDIIRPFRPSLSQEKVVYLTRWGILVLGLCALVLALLLKGVITTLFFAYTIYTCGLILPVIAGFYRERLRVTPVGALVATVGGGAVALVSKIFGITYLDLGGLAVSAVLLFVVSFIDNKRRSRKLSV